MWRYEHDFPDKDYIEREKFMDDEVREQMEERREYREVTFIGFSPDGNFYAVSSKKSVIEIYLNLILKSFFYIFNLLKKVLVNKTNIRKLQIS